MRAHLRWMGTCALAATLLAGCADDSGGASEGADGETSAPTSQSSEEPEETDTPSTTGGPDAPARPSAGCGSEPGESLETQQVELVSGGTPRSYLITTPEPDGEPAPLVLDLHGLMEGSQVHAQHSGLGEFGQEHGFVTVFPHGSGEPVAWNAGGGGDNPDLAYLDAVMERVTAEHCIDEARVYATGLSNGAMMTSLLACERSERFAAVAPVDGITAPEPCEQQRPVPILTTHGTADPILQFNGGIDVSSFLGGEDAGGDGSTTTSTPADLDGEGYPATVATWADRYDCDPEPAEERITESVLHLVYDCPDGAELEFHIVEGGGHTWPGSEFGRTIEAVTGPTTFEIDWNELAWEFFQRHSLP